MKDEDELAVPAMAMQAIKRTLATLKTRQRP
jgi:hypothetical protein